ncbi:hypothetical protein WT53_01930 [Burkholderia sp. MSMB2157WGS]|nr:hypothetical protein WT53_01930 [Burkholderia sp. MSMB2157WGS]
MVLAFGILFEFLDSSFESFFAEEAHIVLPNFSVGIACFNSIENFEEKGHAISRHAATRQY